MTPRRALAVLFASVFAIATSRAADDPAKPPPELKVLERYAGNWTLEITNKPSVWIPDGSRDKGTAKNEWILLGRYLQGKAVAAEGKYEGALLRTYDPNGKAYRDWYFDSAGGVSEARGQWDEAAKTMTWRGESRDAGFVSISRDRWLDADTFEWTSVIKDKDGKVLLDQSGKSTRKK